MKYIERWKQFLLKEKFNQFYQSVDSYPKDAKITVQEGEIDEAILSNLININQQASDKPSGLWYGIGPNWIQYCEEHVPSRSDIYTSAYILDIDMSKVLHLSTYNDLSKFSKTYGTNDRSGRVLTTIDWVKVSTQFSGIEISPYIYKARLDIEIPWYYVWDIASGCIWNKDVIKNFKEIEYNKFRDTKRPD